MLGGCSVDVRWMLGGCWVDAGWMLGECSVDVAIDVEVYMKVENWR